MAKFHNWEFEFKKPGLGQGEKDSLKSEKDFLEKWITEGIDEKMIEWAEKFGKYLAKLKDIAKDKQGNVIKIKNNDQELKELSSSQLRKFFGALKALQNEILMDLGLQDNSEITKYKHQLIMLKPQLAYAAARAKSDYAKIHNFHEIISKCIDHVKTKKQFKNFISLVEAIVAYHKVEEESKKKTSNSEA